MDDKALECMNSRVTRGNNLKTWMVNTRNILEVIDKKGVNWCIYPRDDR